MSSYSELIAQRDAIARQQAELERLINEQLKEQRSNAIAQVKSIMSEFGLSQDDISTGKSGRKPKDATEMGASKVAPKYRDPATGKTWSGRGLKPRWLSEALNAGKQIADFVI